MKYLFTLVFVLAIYSTTRSQALENTLLWKISGNDIEEPSYLFGTIHISCDATLNEQVTQALDATTLLVLEIDMDDPAMPMNMMKLMNMKEKQSLSQLLNKEDYQLLHQFYKEQFGINIEAMHTVKPFFLSAMIYPKLLDCPTQSLETELVKVAHSQNEEVLGLETIEDQMSIFDEIPYEEQVSELLKSVKDSLKTDKENFTKMLEIYKKQDLSAMVNLIMEDTTATTAKYADKLLIDRNQKWIPKIIEFTRKKPTFFGVGAGHLGGEFGVINLLKAKGYILTPIYN